jgi:hypothetical protein
MLFTVDLLDVVIHRAPPVSLGFRWVARGPRSGTEILIGVLVAQCVTLQGRGPSAKLTSGSLDQENIGIAGEPGTIFTSARRHRQGYWNSRQILRERCRTKQSNTRYHLAIVDVDRERSAAEANDRIGRSDKEGR